MLLTSESVTEGYLNIKKPSHLEMLSKNHPFKILAIKYIKQNFNKISQREIARRLKIGKTTVNNWSKQIGLVFKKHTVNEDFFKTWSDKMAYILGYIITDGNIAWDTGKCYSSLTITASEKDKDHLEIIRNLICSTKPLLYSAKTKSYRLIAVNKTICRDLMGLGIIPRKSLVVKFPKIPQKYLSHFIRGVIDGDGSIKYCKRPRSPYFEIGIASGSSDFIEGLRKTIYDNIGADSAITHRINCYLLRYCCSRGLKLARWIYRNKSLYLKRKYKKYLEAIHAQQQKNGGRLNSNQNSFHLGVGY